ncbi:MAG: sulfur reduction protein DsrE [Pseudomonadota bacterium]
MNVAMIVSSAMPEVQWNALRLANLMLNEEDEVTIFLNGPAVDFRPGDSPQYPLNLLAKTFVLSEGVLLA